MRNYLKAELFRNFNRIYLWGIIGAIMVCSILGCCGLRYINGISDQNLTLEVVILIGINMISAYTYLMGLFTDLSIGEEFKNNTIKNIMSSGMSRSKIYVCKIIESMILMIICSVTVLVSTVIIGYFILGINSSESFIKVLQTCLMRGSSATLLWTGSIAFSGVLVIITGSGTIASLVYVGTFMTLENILMILGTYINPIFSTIKEYLISAQLGKLTVESNVSVEVLVTTGCIGLAYTVILTILGIKLLNKRDI